MGWDGWEASIGATRGFDARASPQARLNFQGQRAVIRSPKFAGGSEPTGVWVVQTKNEKRDSARRVLTLAAAGRGFRTPAR